MRGRNVPPNIRVSLGSAILLGLTQGVMEAEPTTIYLLTYHTGKCLANCGFCSQARSSTSRADMLSRVTWPIFPTKKVLDHIGILEEERIKRICIQTMNYPHMFEEVLGLVRGIRVRVNIPLSISCQPLTSIQIQQLKEAGIDRVGIPLDAPTEKLFDEVKGSSAGGPYRWAQHLTALRTAVQTLGEGRVSTHFIVGLGERDVELLSGIQQMIEIGVYPALFAFTPISGTRFEGGTQPPIERYRRIQLAHYLMTTGKARLVDLVFNDQGNISGFRLDRNFLKETVKMGVPFMTSGCPGCNRPFFNERVGGPLYNYPRRLSTKEIAEIEKVIVGV